MFAYNKFTQEEDYKRHNRMKKVSRTIIENCPAPCYFTQYLGYVIK